MRTVVQTVQKRWLTTREAMTYLGCSDDFLQSLTKKKQLPCRVYKGKMKWYELADLDRVVTAFSVQV